MSMWISRPANLMLHGLILALVIIVPDTQGAKSPITFGVVLPHSKFESRGQRSAMKQVDMALNEFKSRTNYGESNYNFNLHFEHPNRIIKMMNSTEPGPAEILDLLCDTLLGANVSTIIYITNSESFDQNRLGTQYFLQLVGYLGIPVIAWNADNLGLQQEQKMPDSLILQLAPSVLHQTDAMLSILDRYNWNQFDVITTTIPGHREFVQALKDSIQHKSNFKNAMQGVTTLRSIRSDAIQSELEPLLKKETRIILLCATVVEASAIFAVAHALKLTGKEYVWIVSQSVVSNMQSPNKFYLKTYPAGLLGIHFDTSEEYLAMEAGQAARVFCHGLELFVKDPSNANLTLQPGISCQGRGKTRWDLGQKFHSYLSKVSVSTKSNPPIEFNADGTQKHAELDIVNFNNKQTWVKIGRWSFNGLDIKDITWPRNSPFPPAGKPEKFHLSVTFLEEVPYMKREGRDPMTNKCSNRGVPCRIVPDSQLVGVNMTEAKANEEIYQCCSGFCIDLLEKLAADIGFTYELVRVEDGIWGTKVNGTWNGLVAALLQRKTDMVMTSLKINSEREEAIDFSTPFLDTGIAVVVSKRTGIVSPKAFLEPFDAISWILILFVLIQLAGMAIFLFEWFSPSGYNMSLRPPRDHKFSLFRAYWLVWSMLFGAAVNIDCPRGFTSRFMSNVWAMFAVVFLAIYTANLAAFMITREEFYELAGLNDKRLLNPFTVKPAFRFGTLRWGNTEAVIKQNFPEMYDYMRHFKKSNVIEGIQAVKSGELDAFIYDSTVLEYLATLDDECRLLTVGSWYAMTGYGVAFPPRSKYLDVFNKQMLIYKERGDLEKMRTFWMTGACQPNKEGRSTSEPLGIKQFISAFILLGSGIVLAGAFLAFEQSYVKCLRRPLAKSGFAKCCNLVSLSLGKSLTFRDAVIEAKGVMDGHRCSEPKCKTQLWKLKRLLDLANMRIGQLENYLQTHRSGSLEESPSDSGDRPSDDQTADASKRRTMSGYRVSANEPRSGKYPNVSYSAIEVAPQNETFI